MNNPPEWATHIMINPLTRGSSYWWSEKWFQATCGEYAAYDRYSNYFPKEEWKVAGWIFVEINIQLEND